MGLQPVYRHQSSDLEHFRLTIAQLIDSGCCRPCEIIRAFGISKSHVDRTTRLYRQRGAGGFFSDRKRKQTGGGTVMTEAVLNSAQTLLDEGMPKAEVAAQMGVAYGTFRRALWDGRLRERSEPDPPVDKSGRSVEDADAGAAMGTACTRAGERMMAALGQLNGAASRFQLCRDVPFGGVPLRRRRFARQRPSERSVTITRAHPRLLHRDPGLAAFSLHGLVPYQDCRSGQATLDRKSASQCSSSR